MSDATNECVLSCEGLSKTFREGADAVQVLHAVTLESDAHHARR